MTEKQIKAEWAAFIEYPPGSDGLHVTTTSALLFAEHVALVAVAREREACASVCENTGSCSCDDHLHCAAAIRARGQ